MYKYVGLLHIVYLVPGRQQNKHNKILGDVDHDGDDDGGEDDDEDAHRLVSWFIHTIDHRSGQSTANSRAMIQKKYEVRNFIFINGTQYWGSLGTIPRPPRRGLAATADLQHIKCI